MLAPLLRLNLFLFLLYCGAAEAFAATPAPVLQKLAEFELPPLDPNYRLSNPADGWYYGTSTRGGPNNRGMFFRVNATGRFESLSPRVTAEFRASTPAPPEAGRDGAVYLICGRSLYRFSESAGLTQIAARDSPELPGFFVSSLALATDGNVYGATNQVLYKVAAGGTLSIVCTFAQPLPDFVVAPIVMGSDGALYVVSRDGTTSRITTAGVQTALGKFGSGPVEIATSAPTGRMAVGSDGALYEISSPSTVVRIGTDGTLSIAAQWPGNEELASGLTAAADGRLYTISRVGGEFGFGSILRYTPGAGLARVVSFTGKSGAFPGRRPIGQLSRRPDGSLIGVSAPTGSPGDIDPGAVFQILPSGEAQSLGTMIDAELPRQYARLCDELAVAQDGTAVGLSAMRAGAAGAQVVFRISPAGECTTISDFTQSGGTLPGESVFTSGWPSPLAAADGSLLFATINGGDSLNACVVRRDPLGDVNLVYASDRLDTGWPYAHPYTPSVQRADGRIYGITEDESPNGQTSIYRISGNGTLSKLAQFTGAFGELPGSRSYGWLTEGSDGHLYGCTINGGPVGTDGGAGTVFRISPNDQVTSCATFTGTGGSLPGKHPDGRMVLAAAGALYGVAPEGGASNNGVLFQIAPGGVARTVVQFTGLSGAAPGSVPRRVLVAPNGGLIGVTSSGGALNKGTVFKVGASGALASIGVFTGSAGALPGEGPTADFVAAGEGVFYGTTSAGGAYGFGTIFRVRADGVVEHVADFTDDTGVLPGDGSTATLLRRGTAVYCATVRGGAQGGGILLRTDAAGGFTKLLDLPGAGRSSTIAIPLTLTREGSIIGVSAFGASTGAGVLFQVYFPRFAAKDDLVELGVETIDVRANDEQLTVDATISAISQPAHGQATLQTNGMIRYVPNETFAGEDTFTYTLTEGAESSSATVFIRDTTPPFAPAGPAISVPPGLDGMVLPDLTGELQVSDLGGIAGISQVPPAGTVVPLSPEQYVNFTITDRAGNQAHTSRLVVATPPAPGGLSGMADDGQVALRWNAVSGASSYLVKRSLSSDSGFADVGAVSVTSYTDNAVTNGATYYYIVAAANSFGASGNSAPVAVRPSVPISADERRAPKAAISTGSVSLTVQFPVVGHTYQLQYCDDLGSGAWQNYGEPCEGSGSGFQLTMPFDPSVS